MQQSASELTAAPSRPARPVRLGAVSYLNTEPLLAGLSSAAFQLRADVPARCWELLEEGAVDLGIIPVVGLAEDHELVVVPEVAIASEGAVRSVLLVSRRPPEALRSIALDRSSRTSAVLVRLLCAERYGVAPQLAPAAPDWRRMLAEHDGALLIGDPALDLAERAAAGRLEPELRITDLGAEWTAMTGLPFVYAVWAGRPPAVTPAVVAALVAARDRGLASLPAIAARSAAEPERRARHLDYLRHAIRYQLGERERRGLERFLQLAAAHALLPARPAIRFAGAPAPPARPAAAGRTDGA